MKIAANVLVGAGLVLSAQGAGIAFNSSETQTSLLELYTSEGCSSCPPAEASLSRWKSSPRLWKDFVPVAFHVDYWNGLGWRDPWSAKSSSDRQQAYARLWGSENIYTPEFVLNGREWRDWPGRDVPGVDPSRKPGVLTLSSSDTNTWQVLFRPTVTGAATYEAHVVLAQCGVVSAVTAGENRGRRLLDDFAVTALADVPLVVNGVAAAGTLTLAAPKRVRGSLAVVVWITLADRLEPVQATGGWIRHLDE
ncbi:MAG TPA: DUF1223 domain-containing protein [Verrucomicrobiae bacterium]|jgi:hypothetical protein|nr:DUF1223 domain-containing protein [Verrucomicrobiae bacterium]